MFLSNIFGDFWRYLPALTTRRNFYFSMYALCIGALWHLFSLKSGNCRKGLHRSCLTEKRWAGDLRARLKSNIASSINNPRWVIFSTTKLEIIFVTTFKGIIWTSGPQWSTQRRFSLKTLKDFGFGKDRIEDSIHFEVGGNFIKVWHSGSTNSTY